PRHPDADGLQEGHAGVQPGRRSAARCPRRSGAAGRGTRRRGRNQGAEQRPTAVAGARDSVQPVNNSFVLVERPRPNISLITLNRPERMNSMAFDVMVPLKEAVEKVTYDNEVRVVVLTGAGHGFSSGADHKSAGSVPNIDGLTRPTFALR